jgi:hypothetical protein
MAGGRPPGKKNSHKATRRQTLAQKELQAQRTRETKQKTKQQKEAQKKAAAEKKKAEGKAKWRGFFGGQEDQPQSSPEIEAMRYFKPHLYDECIERHAPAPRILYYRVRAVFTLFGNMVDSKTKKPLLNAEAWKKANQVLKEILLGFYSDPPGENLYSKKMKSDGTVMKNKYGMDLIECFRGTNRVEAYHKHLVPSVKSRNFGVKMADSLLAEKRHRHNQNISERRRAGFPKLGHYSTHKVVRQYKRPYVKTACLAGPF